MVPVRRHKTWVRRSVAGAGTDQRLLEEQIRTFVEKARAAGVEIELLQRPDEDRVFDDLVKHGKEP